MASHWGKTLELSIFGESHGSALGITIGNLPAGFSLDMQAINKDMSTRAPGGYLATPRKEGDEVEILSGLLNGVTTGAPLCGIIRNNDTKSKDYSKLQDQPRPGHSDYPAFVKYQAYNDIRGGGHFSGRLTAPLVFAGAIARQFLAQKGIIIASHISSIHNIHDSEFGDPDRNVLNNLCQQDFPLLDPSVQQKMEESIIHARENKDSVGGTVEVGILGVKAGLGEPFFHSLESSLASLIFSIPSIKGLEFGDGFGLSSQYGSESNDEYYYNQDEITTKTHSQGGILGGITTGTFLRFKVAVKPTASIAKAQNTVNLKEKCNTVLSVEGRHDPCIVPRVRIVVESVAALAIFDMILGEFCEFR